MHVYTLPADKISLSASFELSDYFSLECLNEIVNSSTLKHNDSYRQYVNTNEQDGGVLY